MKAKKIFSLLLAVILVLTIVACGEKETPDDPNVLTIGPYNAEYKGCEITADSEGNDAIVINFTFHNGGEEEESFEWAYYYTLMQGDTEMEYAVVWVSEDSFDTLDESTRVNVAPGGSHDVSLTYKLKDSISPIVMNVSDLFNEEHDSITIDPATASPRANAPAADSAEPDDSADSDAGYWTLAYSESEDPDLVIDEEIIEALKSVGVEMFVELREDGTGTFVIEEPWEITWGDGLFTLEGDSIPYTRVDDELIVDAEITVYHFVRGEGSAPEASAPVTDVDFEAIWCGDWYGWWGIAEGSTGYYEDLIGESWDCCAYIEPYEDQYLMTIWDTDFNDYAENALSEVFIEFDYSIIGDVGMAVSSDDERNYFWAGNVGYSDWYMDPGILGSDNTIVFGNQYTDDDGDTLVYSVILTKWPNKWDTELMAAPEYYESFFVPLMEAGEELPIVFDPENP